MPLYEMVYILSTKVPRAQQSAVMSGIARDILAQGGVIRQLSNEGICQMQYTMRRFGVAVWLVIIVVSDEECALLISKYCSAAFHVVLAFS